MRIRTRIFIVFVGLAAVGTGVAVKVWQHYTDPSYLRGELERRFAEAFQGQLHVGSVSVSPRGRVTVEDVEIIPPGGGEPIVRCGGIAVDLDRVHLLRGRPVPRRVVLQHVELRLEALDGGRRWNVEALRRPGVAPPGGGEWVEGLLRDGLILQNASVSLRMDPAGPGAGEFKLDGVHLDLRPDPTVEGAWALRGQVSRGALEGTALSGQVVSSLSGLGLQLEIDCPELRADEELIKSIPVVGASLWRDFQPSGPMALNAVLRAGGTHGALRVRGRVGLRGVTVWVEEFSPVPISAVFGTVEFQDNKLYLRDLTGMVQPTDLGFDPAGSVAPTVTVSGTHDFERGNNQTTVLIRDLPVSRRTLEAVPGAGESIWEALAPGGTADVTIRVSTPPGPGHTSSVVTVRLKDGTIRPPGLLPVKSLTGMIEVRDGRARFTEMAGMVDGEALGLVGQDDVSASVDLSGYFDIRTRHLEIDFHCRGMPICRRTVELIPEVGPDLWQALESAGRCDLSVHASVPSEGPARYHCVVSLRGAKVLPRELPLGVEDLTGEVAVDNEGVRFSNVRGTIPQRGAVGGGGHLGLSGLYDPTGGRTRLKVEVRNLRADEELVKALPGSGERMWALLHPQGCLDATLLVSTGGPGHKLATSGTVGIRSGSALPAFCPIPLENVAGTLYLTGSTLQFDGLSGRVVSEGDGAESGADSFGYMTLRGTMDLESETGAFQFEVADIYLARRLVESIPSVGKTLWRIARPRGEVSLSGKVVYDAAKPSPLSFFIDAQLKNVSMEPGDPPLRLEAMSGHILLTERQAVTSSVKGRLASGWFNAAAVADFDPAGDTVSYNGTVELRHARLETLWPELTGKEDELSGLLSGVLELKGRAGERESRSGSGTLVLKDGRMWSAPFFMAVLDVLHLSAPGKGAFDEGQMHFRLEGDKVRVEDFRVASNGLELTGYGTIGPRPVRELDLVIVAGTVADPKKKTWLISLLLKPIRWVVGGIERELVKLRVTGTLDAPKFTPMILAPLAHPLGSLRDLLFGSPEKENKGEGRKEGSSESSQ